MQNFGAVFAEASRPCTDTENCVRWNPKKDRYELVVGGTVTAYASRLKLSVPKLRAQFLTEVNAAAAVVRRIKRESDEGRRSV